MDFPHVLVSGNVVGKLSTRRYESRTSSDGVFRRTTTDVNMKGYAIPKGWKVFSSFRAVHLDHDRRSNFQSMEMAEYPGDELFGKLLHTVQRRASIVPRI
ncbi:hypothetical protein V6N13_092437 [Hibiscus sabdariffa]